MKNVKIKTMKQKLLSDEKITVVVDSREFFSPVVDELSSLGVQIVEKQLDVADYVCSERVGIERKKAEDFSASIIDGRLFEQVTRLSEAYEKPVIIIEGYNFFNRNINPNAVYGAIASLISRFNISVFRTETPRETALLIYSIAKKEQIDNGKDVAIRFKPKSNSIPKIQEYLVSGLPKINIKLARRLLSVFKTPKNVFSASESELRKVEGIGEKKARIIWKILNEEWREEDV